MNYSQLVENIKRKRSFLCVGLDTDETRLPLHLKSDPDGIFRFNREIIDATAKWCVAYKPNLAFYEALGTKGLNALAQTIQYIRTQYPDQFIIADAKRGDIGNTAAMYARSILGTLDADAVTVAPYMGADSVMPFLDYEGKWVILLALTSNPGSKDFQLLQTESGLQLFEQVITTARTWAGEDKLMFVVGATQGKLFEKIRNIAPRNFLLVPGVGAQGGSLEEVVKYGMTDDCGLLVNASRSILYASSGKDFAEAAAAEAQKLATQMSTLLPF